jgi:hypothetical protein
MSQRAARPQATRPASWCTILLVVAGLSLGGWSLLGCTTQPPTVAVSTPTAGTAATPLPTSTATAEPQRLTRIAILHSNDTWGYTLPCG